MTTPTSFDAVVVGGGPAGSLCARSLVQGGLRVAVLDRMRFPRVKLCAGWLSPPVWDVLRLSPSQYPAGIWEWTRCHVQHGGQCHTLAGQGHFIRRYEFDQFLLERSGAEIIQHSVRSIERTNGGYSIDGAFTSRILIGAGGTHCPVARALFPKKSTTPVGVQEHEFVAGGDAVARTRVGQDGEPELLLHDDLGGYSWNVPKGEWLNVGTGTSEPREVLAGWAMARDFFTHSGHVPESAAAKLDQVKGHSYYLFDPSHLEGCEQDGAFLVGDALGLAHPLTAEGILPALLSGKLAADAILRGTPASYRVELERHPVMQDYALARALLVTAIALRDKLGGAARVPSPPQLTRWSQRATAKGFAWMFSGRPIPYGEALRAMLRGMRSLTEVRTES
ncbi:MAG TPA: NAD(P)/FAD-dependent oxidoreductase [Polyangiaceae bacterium]|nr:NAD(P)/FAD-dependent oxidoreductase [Polyangiaceae bacterium]